MRVRIIDEENGNRFSIRPEQINTDRHFWGAFRDMETERAASWIVLLCQRLGGWWVPFNGEQINQFYRSWGHKWDFSFRNLLTLGVVVHGLDERYRVTDAFILRCYESSPADTDVFPFGEIIPPPA